MRFRSVTNCNDDIVHAVGIPADKPPGDISREINPLEKNPTEGNPRGVSKIVKVTICMKTGTKPYS